jgi:hypothetical protein
MRILQRMAHTRLRTKMLLTGLAYSLVRSHRMCPTTG